MIKMLWLVMSFGVFNLISAQDKHYPPRDETNSDPSLSAFVAELKRAVDKHDQDWIMKSLADDVESGFDNEGGKADFNNMWNVDNDSSDFWLMTSRIISMGGVFLHDTADWTGKYQFVFPYIYDIELNVEDDYYDMGIITGKNVNLRAKPDIKSEVVGQLTYNIVHFVTNESEGLQVTSGSNGLGEPEWYKIETYGKDKTGWVNWKFVYNLMGPRLFLYKDNKDGWKISAFLTGD